MEDLKIRVANKAESKEAQELFFELGFEKKSVSNHYPSWISNFEYLNGRIERYTSEPSESWALKCKEITIQELKDLVVLKRNSVDDATHEDYSGLKHLLLTHTRHVWGGDMWLISSADFSKLKTIQKEKIVEEFLNPDQNYSLVKCFVGETTIPESWIEVPEGAEIYTKHDTGENVFYRKGLDFLDYFDNKWLPTKYSTNGFTGEMKCNGRTVLWQREKESIIDKLVDDLPEFKHNAESEKRSHGHYFKDVSQLNEIDVYHVLKLFEVTDPCVQHIVKKALCAGKRGHKDMMEDLQNIVDTAVRAVELNK